METEEKKEAGKAEVLWRRLRDWVTVKPAEPQPWQEHWSKLLEHHVAFYRQLPVEQRMEFERRITLFWQTTEIVAGQFEVEDLDRLLVAASAIIPVWSFPNWHYLNLKTVYLLPASFNQRFECGKLDSVMTGMVGTGPMSGKMALSCPALRHGFDNSRDKQNVGIHEFVHLIDLADGDGDGFPERLREYAFAAPWFKLMAEKTLSINDKQTNINDYAGSNTMEFLAVASEYFFERPRMMQRKHPKLYRALSELYKQDVAAIEEDLQPRKKAPCPCGSGKRYKHCCMPKS
jgi:MtfA peptidase